MVFICLKAFNLKGLAVLLLPVMCFCHFHHVAFYVKFDFALVSSFIKSLVLLCYREKNGSVQNSDEKWNSREWWHGSLC